MKSSSLVTGVGITALIGLGTTVISAWADAPKSLPGEVAVTFAGGHDAASQDYGRPVRLIAFALGVPTEVFREAFTHVHPAQGGGGPTPTEAQQNKRELLSRLQPYGVTNGRLDAVSNFYRYRPQNGELWRHKDAVAFATIKDGKVTGFRIAEPGYGYLTPPTISVNGMPGMKAVPTQRFSEDLEKNGSIESIALAPPTTAP